MIKDMITVYLAHSVHERQKGKMIQEYLEHKGFKVINPFDRQLVPNNKDFEWKNPTTDPASLIKNDLKMIDKSDYVLAIFPDDLTIGISCEMFYLGRNTKMFFR